MTYKKEILSGLRGAERAAKELSESAHRAENVTLDFGEQLDTLFSDARKISDILREVQCPICRLPYSWSPEEGPCLGGHHEEISVIIRAFLENE